MTQKATTQATITAINNACKQGGGVYSGYSCKSVSWDDAERGTVGGSLSCWGANITDTRLYEKSGRALYTVRPDNWNEKLGSVTAKDVALIVGNHDPANNGALQPITLHDYLKSAGVYGEYAGLQKSADLSDSDAKAKVSIRFQTTFLPVPGGTSPDDLPTVEFAPEAYNYNTRDDSDPRNLLLLCTSQGTAVQQDGAGAKKLYHHAIDPSPPTSGADKGKKLCRYWFEAEQSTHKVGGAQVETKEEAEAAAKRGKATSSVIGVRGMGTRFNALLTVQVPLQQKPKPKPKPKKPKKSMSHLFGSYGKSSCPPQSCPSPTWSDSMVECMSKGMSMSTMSNLDAMAAPASLAMAFKSLPEKSSSSLLCMDMVDDLEDDTWDGADLGDFDLGLDADELMSYSASAPAPAPSGARKRERKAEARVGTANAARVSRGSMEDRVAATVTIGGGGSGRGSSTPATHKPKRDPSCAITVTVVLYNTCAGGVPSAADVRAAVDDMERLYASCDWDGRLAEGGAAFMKSELTAQSAADIAAKVAEQPYKPPTATVHNAGVFPVSTSPRACQHVILQQQHVPSC